MYMSTNPEVQAYIRKQLQSGLSIETVTAQLKNAGWQDAAVQAEMAFALQPVQTAAQQSAQTTTLPPPLQQSRMKTGWQLFKQSFSIIKNNPGLSRYVAASTGWVILLVVILAGIFIIDWLNLQLLSEAGLDENGDETVYVTLPGVIVLAAWTFVQTFVTLFYATALSSHVLATFKGAQTTYSTNIAAARKKLGPIATYTLISMVIGVLLRLLDRVRFVGWIVSRILGAVWELATAFTVPLIADKSVGGIAAVKQSLSLFKSNWGETITARVSVGGFVFLIYLLITIPLTILLGFGLTMAFGFVGVVIAIALFILTTVLLAVVQALVTNVLNVALYYYATYKIVPPSFSPELLASVFTQRKRFKHNKITD